jgi:hypothetical protein
MKKYEGDIIFGTFLTLIGVLVIYQMGLGILLGIIIILIGKLIIVTGIMEHSDRKRALKGEDLSKDGKFRKKFRRIRRKYRY